MPWVVWIDAVCSNQDDKAEKSKQIPLMTWIYPKAQRVLLWLGPSNRFTESAFEKLKLLAILWAQRAAKGPMRKRRQQNFAQSIIRKRTQLDKKTMLDFSHQHVWTSGYASLKGESNKFCDLSPTNGLLESQVFDFDNTNLWKAAVEDLFARTFFSRA